MTTILHIEGMSCGHCVRHVTEALEELAGVNSVRVSLEEKRAVIEHDASLNIQALVAAVAEAGYEASH